MTMKRIIRNRPLTPEEVAKHTAIREQVAEELQDLIARHHERMTTSGKERLEKIRPLRYKRTLDPP